MSFSVTITTDRGVERVDFECPGWVSKHTLSIPGWFTIREAEAIVRGALAFGPTGRLVELGTWRGRSAAILADALGAGWMVETFDSYPETYKGADEKDASPALAREAAALELEPRLNVQRLELPSTAGCGRPVRVLFVDAEHSRAAVERDVRAWLPWMADRALIFFHDTNDPRVGDDVKAGALAGLGPGADAVWKRRPDLEVDSLWAFARGIGEGR